MNIVLYVISFIHAINLGTDLKSGLIREIFIGMNIVLATLMIASLLWKLKGLIFKKSDANLSESDSSGVTK
jgi:hypothetical protein